MRLRRPRVTGRSAAGLACWVAGASCIIPDRDIVVRTERPNNGAVRILERPPLDASMDSICNAGEPMDDGEKLARRGGDVAFCPPIVRWTRPSGLLRGPFCVCPDGLRDARALDAASFAIYAEDADREGGEPVDALFGAWLLDVRRSGDPLEASRHYLDLWNPEEPAFIIPAANRRVEEGELRHIEVDPEGGIDRTAPSEARDPPVVHEFQMRGNKQVIGRDGTPREVIDLCNLPPALGSSTFMVGLHDLQFLVTDRPFFEEVLPALDPAHPPSKRLRIGVPDLAAGATYDYVSYVFECLDATLEPSRCECVEGG